MGACLFPRTHCSHSGVLTQGLATIKIHLFESTGFQMIFDHSLLPTSTSVRLSVLTRRSLSCMSPYNVC